MCVEYSYSVAMVYNSVMSHQDFKLSEQYTPRTNREKRLVKALSLLDSEKESASLIRDMLTTAEIEEFSNRLEVAVLLKKGLSYLDIAKKVGVSTTTVTRVAHWLFKGCGGYKKTLEKLGE